MLDIDAEAPELRALATYYRERGGALWLAPQGMVATAPAEPGTWEICRVYVHPEAHGAGLGRALLETAERHAIAAGATELTLWTDTRFHRAHRFYEKHGYVRMGPIRALDDIARTLEYRYVKPVAGVRRLDVAAAQSAERRLADILCVCVDAGALVSFFAPLTSDRARPFWADVTSAVGQGTTILLAAWAQASLAGTIQLKLHRSELGRHRADVAKFLVHPDHRGRGIGAALLQAAEAEARAAGRTLLLLDTHPGDPAEALYRRHQWQEIGRVANYTIDRDGRSEATVLFAKELN